MMGYEELASVRVAPVRDEDLLDVVDSPAARALRAAIVAEPAMVGPAVVGPAVVEPAVVDPPSGAPAPRRRLVVRLALASTVVTAVTTVAVVAPSLLADGTGAATSYASEAIDVRLDGHFYVARIKDPLADRARYMEAFRAVGKDVTIDLVPVSPRYVGQWLSAWSEANKTVEVATELVPAHGEDCSVVPDECTLIIRISADTTGALKYTFGRAARPGEALQDPAPPTDPPVNNGGTSGGGP